MKLGDKIVSLQFSATNNLKANISDYQGQWLILYFYPKDSTPGCTTEGQDFRAAYQTLQILNTTVLGVSRDSLQSHEKFKCAQQFPFELISDDDEALCKYFDVIKLKNMYGKQIQGIERSTFIIDTNGILKHAWRNVTVNGHVLNVIEILKELQSNQRF